MIGLDASRALAALLSFGAAAAGTLAALGEEAPRAPVVIVVDCDRKEDLCSAALSAAAVSAGDADME